MRKLFIGGAVLLSLWLGVLGVAAIVRVFVMVRAHRHQSVQSPTPTHASVNGNDVKTGIER